MANLKIAIAKLVNNYLVLIDLPPPIVDTFAAVKIYLLIY